MEQYGVWGRVPPSDTTRIPTLLRMLYIVLRADGDFGPDFCFSGLEGDLEPELVVDGCLLGGPGFADDVAQVAECGDEGADVVVGATVPRINGLWRRQSHDPQPGNIVDRSSHDGYPSLVGAGHVLL
jgi:hypothetical protein